MICQPFLQSLYFCHFILPYDLFKLDIPASGTRDSSEMETGVPDTETILIGLVVIIREMRNCQARNRFTVRKQALQ